MRENRQGLVRMWRNPHIANGSVKWYNHCEKRVWWLFKHMLCCAELLSRVRLFATPWTVAHQAPLFMGILQARILESVAMPSFRESSQLRAQTQSSTLQAYSLPSEPSRKALK